jgi:HAD superfamily hydrolase (TIGR01493 family)
MYDGVVSVDGAKSYKPDKAVYSWALSSLGVKPEDSIMVAVHDW